jgi:hypothetical protein
VKMTMCASISSQGAASAFVSSQEFLARKEKILCKFQ